MTSRNTVLFALIALSALWGLHGEGKLSAQGRYALEGVVLDKSTGEPLAGANVRVLGTTRGTITNAQGMYKLLLDSAMQTLVFSYLAYQPETLRVTPTGTGERDIQLVPSPIQLAEVVVLAEDPAVEIIRKAIAHKRSWMNKLHSYSFEAFTRQVLRRDTAIASITEAYTSGFMRGGDTLREIVKKKRQTENIPAAENFASVQKIVNFNEDDISLFSFSINENSSGYTFVGPTSPEALDNYDFRLLTTSTMSGVDIYRIRMTPRTRLKPLFQGEITIADGTYAVMGVDVKPNESFTIPFLRDVDLRYRQQFALYDSLFWMPTDIRINGGFTLSLVGLSLPRVGIDLASTIYEYRINAPIPDSIFSHPRRVVDSTAAVYDSTFWKTNEVLPLTREEQRAYRSLDSTQTLEKQFEPKGPLATLGSSSTESLLDVADVRFNRVEGFFFGAKKTFDKISPYVSLSGGAGYGFSDNVFKYRVGAGLSPFAKKKIIRLDGELYTRLENTPDAGFYGPLAISLMALIDKNDYRDYYLAKGWSVSLTTEPLRYLSGTVRFTAEQEYSVPVVTDYSIFSRTTSYRVNPPSTEGSYRAVGVDLRLGPPEVPLDLVARNALEVSVEHTSPRMFSSEFDFTTCQATLSYGFPTFFRSLLFPPFLRARISAGKGFGTLPPQRSFSLESRSTGYSPFGTLKGSAVKEFGGDSYVMINLEHNFRSIPFLALDIPYFYRNGIDLILQASFAQAWSGPLSTTGGWYAETGIGISRILDLLRADFTYRFKEPKRFYFTFSIANLL
jgi:hypothetical protein